MARGSLLAMFGLNLNDAYTQLAITALLLALALWHTYDMWRNRVPALPASIRSKLPVPHVSSAA
jgi:hypothetical protein